MLPEARKDLVDIMVKARNYIDKLMEDKFEWDMQIEFKLEAAHIIFDEEKGEIIGEKITFDEISEYK